ncbi:hypothetical protein O181_131920 [Austropuccinia psidii MF-1]|uniref:Uncharacterized protein n=1 Tax=Austropuccinia psidii MF-1 TaxID=1389203 RepID=A0A9Q3QCE7_9BASI|nr:hypothetical protein [Austropuccinia psidii MF-1]
MTIDCKNQVMDSGNHQRPPVTFKKSFPSQSGKNLTQLNGTQSVGTRTGAYMVLYTIMHHFSSEILWLWLQDSMMSFQIKSPNPLPHFKGIPQSFSLAIHGGYQKTI